MNLPVKLSLAELIAQKRSAAKPTLAAPSHPASPASPASQDAPTPKPTLIAIAVRKTLAQIIAESKQPIDSVGAPPSIISMPAKTTTEHPTASLASAKQTETFSLSVVLNADQLLAKELAFKG